MLVLDPSCNCAEAKPYVEHLSHQRLLMFLMGLNETYSHVRSDILLKSDIPNINQAYTIVVQEGSQRMLCVIDIRKEPFTMVASRIQNFRGKKLLDTACENHLSKDCYRVVGYPIDFKSKRK